MQVLSYFSMQTLLKEAVLVLYVVDDHDNDYEIPDMWPTVL